MKGLHIKIGAILGSFILLFIMACNGTPIPPTATPTLIPPTATPNVTIEILNEKGVIYKEISVEVVPQNNCGGSAEVENQKERSESIAHTIEVATELEFNADGKLTLFGTGVQLGAAVTAKLGYAYGQEESLTRSITVKAKEGTHMQHRIQLQEVWEVGTAKIVVNGQEAEIPFNFRKDFAIELIESTSLPGKCSCGKGIKVGHPQPSEVNLSVGEMITIKAGDAEAPNQIDFDFDWQASDGWVREMGDPPRIIQYTAPATAGKYSITQIASCQGHVFDEKYIPITVSSLNQPSPTITSTLPPPSPSSTPSPIPLPPTATSSPSPPTPTPSPIPRPPTATSSPSPPTSTPTPPSPTITPSPSTTSTPVVTQPSSTPVPIATIPTATPSLAGCLPPEGTLTLLRPVAPDNNTTGVTTFEWQSTGNLPSACGFEVRVWRDGEAPTGVHNALSDNKDGTVQHTTNNSYQLITDISNAYGVQGRGGAYNWTVYLVQIEPEYKDFGITAPSGVLNFSPSGGGDTGNGGSGGTGDPPRNP